MTTVEGNDEDLTEMIDARDNVKLLRKLYSKIALRSPNEMSILHFFNTDRTTL
jgi:hypothetical protein